MSALCAHFSPEMRAKAFEHRPKSRSLATNYSIIFWCQFCCRFSMRLASISFGYECSSTREKQFGLGKNLAFKTGAINRSTIPSVILQKPDLHSRYLEFLGCAADLDLASVTRTTLVEFRNQVAQKASATTTNHDLRAIKALFREAKRDGYIAEDPSEFVDTVRKSFDDKRRPFAIAEIQRILAVADPEWRSLVLFGLYTGQRLSDIAALTWDNLDLSKNEIRLRTRKTAKRIMVPIAKPLRQHINFFAGQ
jgi:site-specific recombinase XerD